MKTKTTVARAGKKNLKTTGTTFFSKHFLFALFLLMNAGMFAQVAYWNPAGLANYGPSPWAATTTTANITVGDLIRGAGVSTVAGSPAPGGWGGCNWTGNATEDATFTVTANPGYIVSFSTFSLSYRRSSTGPNTGTLEYTLGNGTTYTVISTISFANTSITTGVPITPVNLSGVAGLQNVPAGTVIKFRIFPTGSSTPIGGWHILGSIGMGLGGSVIPSSNFYANISQTASVQCNGQVTGALSVSVSGGTGPYTYSWMPAGGTSSVATGLSAGSYTCFITSALSETTTSVFTITQPPVLTSSVSAQTSVACNGGSTGSATVAVNGGHPAYTYSWLPSGGTAATAGNLAAGTYTLNIKDANNCTVSQTVSISQSAVPITVAASNTAICGSGTVALTASGANTYTWSNGVANGFSFTPSSTAVYTVTGTHASSGCVLTATAAIGVYTNPTISVVSTSGSLSTCSGTAITLNGAGANTYTWTGGVTDGISFTPASTTMYTVSGTDVNGCKNSTVITVTVNPTPVVTIVANPTNAAVCEGAALILSGAGALSYEWFDGMIDGTSFVPAASATFSVYGTGANGCVGVAGIPVTVHSNPTLVATAVNTVICKNKTATLTVSGASTYSWSGAETTTAIVVSPVATTNYTVTGIDAHGCKGTASVTQSVSTCTGILSVQDASAETVMIVPNPNNGQFILKTTTAMQLNLINELGQHVRTLHINEINTYEVQVNDLPMGIYFLVGTQNNFSIKQKVIVTN